MTYTLTMRWLLKTHLVMLLLLLNAHPLAYGQPSNAPTRPEYSAFKVIAERNIFSPNRRARSSGVRGARPVTKLESLTLVGTMSYEKGRFAFFEGTKSDYRKVLKPADVIAGFTVADIAPDAVKLASA